MKNHIISTFKSHISSIQLKLSDCFSGITSFEDAIISQLSSTENRNIRNEKELVMHADNHFDLLHPYCPVCGSRKVIKQEYYKRKLKLAEFGSQVIYVRRYYCKTCSKKFTTPLDSIVKKGHQYARTYEHYIEKAYEAGYCSFRHLQKIFTSLYDCSPSHQTIYNWIAGSNRISTSSSTSSEDNHYSGYYCYDEQYIKLNGNRFYRLSLIDSVLNKPVEEKIVPDLEYDTVKGFIKNAVASKPLHCISTDHRRKYKSIMDELKIKHQLCIFHLYKLVGKDVYKKLKSKFNGPREKVRLCLAFTKIKEVFRTYDLNIAINRLQEIISNMEEIPHLLHRSIDKIIKDFERLTLFMVDEMISKTTNPIENYYRQTLPDSLKRIFKTPNGILNYLSVKRGYWEGNISNKV